MYERRVTENTWIIMQVLWHNIKLNNGLLAHLTVLQQSRVRNRGASLAQGQTLISRVGFPLRDRRIHKILKILQMCRNNSRNNLYWFAQSWASYFLNVTSVDLVRWVGQIRRWKLSVVALISKKVLWKLSVDDKSTFGAYPLISLAKNECWKWNRYRRIKRWKLIRWQYRK